MRVAILHNEPTTDAADQDVMLQVHCVRNALSHAGHACIPMACTLDLETVRGRLREERIEVVFNLVESLGGTDRLAVLAPLMLEAIGMPFTGAGAMSMHLTNDKVIAKKMLAAVGIRSPACFDNEPGRYIVKTRFEHASIGMDDGAVVSVTSTEELSAAVAKRQLELGREIFAERFVDGREFNLSIIEGEVLPPAEIDFSAFPEGKPRIVGYKAKWVETSFEFNKTPRRFTFPHHDEGLICDLRSLAVRVWNSVPLDGYVRIDFRVGSDGTIYVLEINPNPCLSPDAGLAAASLEAGMTYEQMIQRMLDAALARGGR